MIIFQTKRLIVRQYQTTDADNFFLLNGDEEVMRYIRPAKSRAECDAFLKVVISDAQAQPLFGRWAVIEKATDAFVGSFAVIPVEGSEHMQLGYALLQPAWGKGYATELTIAGLEYVFTKTVLDAIYAYTEKANLASQKILLKAQFRQDGSKITEGKELVQFVLAKTQYQEMPTSYLPNVSR